MSFELDQFAAIRPYLFHLTSRENVDLLRHTRQLLPASAILSEADACDWLDRKRQDHVKVQFRGQLLLVRDQKPLYQGNTALADGWTFGHLIRSLNDRVFFWPGTSPGVPIAYGERHFERYKSEGPKILRIGTRDLIIENSELTPEFCKYNSGSPRCSGGKGSPRGLETFVTCSQAPFRPSAAIEVTFRGTVSIPTSCEIGDSTVGPWIRF